MCVKRAPPLGLSVDGALGMPVFAEVRCGGHCGVREGYSQSDARTSFARCAHVLRIARGIWELFRGRGEKQLIGNVN